MFSISNNIIKWTGIIALASGLLLIYKFYDPSTSKFFPSCPFHSLTGFLCPGCGSQRAVHHLLNLEFFAAYKQNELLIFSLPFLLVGFIIDRIPNPSIKIISFRNALFGRKAIFIVLGVIMIFWVFRNIS